MEELYKLSFDADGVRMTVINPMASVVKNVVLDRLNRKRLEGFDREIVERLVDSLNTTAIIAPPQQEFIINEDAAVTVSKDRMSAYISFSEPDGGTMLDVGQILIKLQEAKVAFGVDKEQLLKLGSNKDKEYNRNILIASGKAPINGTDAAISVKFSVVRDKTPKILDNGQVDFKNVDRPNAVNKGDLLATFSPSTPGENGTDVTGAEIKAKAGKGKNVPVGKHVYLSDNGTKIYADADGYAEVVDGRITVLRVMEIKGDVGPATGNVDFGGDVVISGDIIKGYNVKAGGSVTLKGCIEASEITAGGDIVIGQGVKGLSTKGKPACLISARGNVTSKFIESARVKATGIIRADSIVNSNVTSFESIQVDGKIGEIIGGNLYALKAIAAQSIGTEGKYTATRTELSVGITADIRNSYVELKQKIEGIEAQVLQIEQQMKECEASPSLKNEKKAYALKQQRQQLEESMFSQLRDARLIREAMKELNTGEVHVLKKMYPPAEVIVGEVKRFFDEKQTNVTIKQDDGAVVTAPCAYIFKK
ncbi:MAG: FapA family protein [Clostridiales bacterium]|jgi:uncharacterized protein (DUF342 family)|nr:FapA family protein [Clostridiales bacterium]